MLGRWRKEASMGLEVLLGAVIAGAIYWYFWGRWEQDDPEVCARCGRDMPLVDEEDARRCDVCLVTDA
jgi:hypothetical protein